MNKIKSKQDLIDYLAALPDDWVPTQCVQWACPEVIEWGTGYKDQEIKQYVDIRLDGPTLIQRISMSADA